MITKYHRAIESEVIDFVSPFHPEVVVEFLTIEEIAAQLSKILRFGGQTAFPYSVAQHSVFVTEMFIQFSNIADRDSSMVMLLHDAFEIIVGDIPTPIKSAIDYDSEIMNNAEIKFYKLLYSKFINENINADSCFEYLNFYDKIALVYEREKLFTRKPSWGSGFELFAKINYDLQTYCLFSDILKESNQEYKPDIWKKQFLKTYEKIQGMK
jgi:5'-deoxynucleotidase YfbR-like HD superfamily hydrolase